MGLEKQNKRIDQLFLRLTAIYGHLWRSLYKNDEFLAYTKREWRSGLEKFDGVVIGKALLYCRQHESYPPSLPLFIELCSSNMRRNNYFKREKKLKGDRSIAHQYLKQMRHILNMKLHQGEK